MRGNYGQSWDPYDAGIKAHEARERAGDALAGAIFGRVIAFQFWFWAWVTTKQRPGGSWFQRELPEHYWVTIGLTLAGLVSWLYGRRESKKREHAKREFAGWTGGQALGCSGNLGTTIIGVVVAAVLAVLSVLVLDYLGVRPND
jgi:hypothetical protein